MVLLLTGIAILSGVASGFAIFYFLVYTLIGVILVGFLWSATNLVGIHVSAKRASGLAKVGEFLEAELFIQNRSPLPKLVLEVRDMADLPGQVTGKVMNLKPFQGVRWLAKSPLKKRGVYKLGPARAYSTDPFGLFRLSRAFPGVDEVTVYPATVDLQDFQLSLSDTFHHGVRYLQSHESASSVSNIREYNPGDGFHRIHWASTARTGRLMVKQFENETRNHVWVVLDMHQDVQAGGEIDNTEEWGVTIAASLAEKFLSMDWPVGIMAHGDHRYLLTPQQTPNFHEELLRVMAMARATGSRPLMQVLRQEWDSFSPSSRVVVITPSTDSSWLQELSGLPSYRSRVAVVLIDAHSFGGHRSSQQAQGVLQQDGIITYVVRQGEPLSVALDYRRTVAYRPVMATISEGH